MKIKDDSVDIWGLDVVMQPVLKHADRLWKELGEELVITSARDGMHSAGSLHYYGRAVDLRTRYFTEPHIANLAQELQRILREISSAYQVIVHNTHMHVEYDKK